MAQRRMFSPDIVESEEFLSMPISSQALYFHLGMNADDDGFINPKPTMRVANIGEDDLKVLLVKRFLLPFESGVVVVKHWLIHNLIRGDRYKPTRYIEEKNSLFIKENRAYTDNPTLGLQNDNQMATQVRLGKVRLGKDILPVPNGTGGNGNDVEIVKDESRMTPAEFYAYQAKGEGYQGHLTRPLMRWAEERMGKKFPKPLKQLAAISSMIRSGYGVEAIKEAWIALEGDEFWSEKGIDFGVVLNQIGKAKRKKKGIPVI